MDFLTLEIEVNKATLMNADGGNENIPLNATQPDQRVWVMCPDTLLDQLIKEETIYGSEYDRDLQIKIEEEKMEEKKREPRKAAIPKHKSNVNVQAKISKGRSLSEKKRTAKERQEEKRKEVERIQEERKRKLMEEEEKRKSRKVAIPKLKSNARIVVKKPSSSKPKFKPILPLTQPRTTSVSANTTHLKQGQHQHQLIMPPSQLPGITYQIFLGKQQTANSNNMLQYTMLQPQPVILQQTSSSDFSSSQVVGSLINNVSFNNK